MFRVWEVGAAHMAVLHGKVGLGLEPGLTLELELELELRSEPKPRQELESDTSSCCASGIQTRRTDLCFQHPLSTNPSLDSLEGGGACPPSEHRSGCASQMTGLAHEYQGSVSSNLLAWVWMQRYEAVGTIEVA